MASLGLPADVSTADAVEAFLRAAAFTLPPPLPLPACLFQPLDPATSDSPLYQRLRRFVAWRLLRFVASSLRRVATSSRRRFVTWRFRRFVASSLRRFVASSLRRFTAFATGPDSVVVRSVSYLVFCFSCSGCQGQCVSRSGGSVVFGVSRSVGSVVFCS
jgi:hypothetical protein